MGCTHREKPLKKKSGHFKHKLRYPYPHSEFLQVDDWLLAFTLGRSGTKASSLVLLLTGCCCVRESLSLGFVAGRAVALSRSVASADFAGHSVYSTRFGGRVGAQAPKIAENPKPKPSVTGLHRTWVATVTVETEGNGTKCRTDACHA